MALLHYREIPKQANLESMFAAYKQANQKFIDVVYEHYKLGDVIWCHDYHLMHYKCRGNLGTVAMGWLIGGARRW
jgi:trehalose 6-phosphate synthase/phosphatase